MKNDEINRGAVYISLSDALDTIYNFDTSDCADVDDVVGRIYEAVGAIPDADVAPVVHARWIPIRMAGERVAIQCSACKNYDNPSSVRGNYCWNCGAKMDGEAE